MKKIILALTITFLVSCTIDDDTIGKHLKTHSLEVIYDSQDNVVKLNDHWAGSIDLQTGEPTNDTLGIRHDWDNKTLYLKSVIYNIESVELHDLDHYTCLSENVATLYIPTMHKHMNYTDWFGLKVVLITK